MNKIIKWVVSVEYLEKGTDHWEWENITKFSQEDAVRAYKEAVDFYINGGDHQSASVSLEGMDANGNCWKLASMSDMLGLYVKFVED